MEVFDGFAPPTENYSKLPHLMIDALPIVETVAEMKVILYVLRHTWGYQDEEKKITQDEFEHGRKRRDGGRLDNGIGLSRNAIKDGIRRAVEHGFLVVREDNRDMGRQRRIYALNMRSPDGQTLTPDPYPDGQTLTPPDQSPPVPGSKPDHRTEKETLETNPEKEKEPAPENGATPETPEDFSDMFPGKPPETSAHPEISEPGILSSGTARDPLAMAAECQRRRDAHGLGTWTVPVEAGGSDDAGDLMLDAWCRTLIIDPTVMPDQMTARYRAKFSKIAKTLPSATPSQAARAVAVVLDPKNPEFSWYTYSDPRVAKFSRDWTTVMLRILSGNEPEPSASGIGALDRLLEETPHGL